MNYTQMETNTMVNLSMERVKGLDFIYGQIQNNMKDSGQEVISMDLEDGKGLKEIHMLEIGKWERQMAMEFTHGTMVSKNK